MATKTPLLLMLIAALCAAAQSLSTNATTSDRIVGGTPTTIAERPYMVALLRRGSFTCGGSLITARHVLTAAHCFYQQVPSDFVAVANTTNRQQRGVRRNFVRFFIHSKFNRNERNFDVAVGKLQRSISAANARPYPLCNHALNVRSRLQVSGWGVTSENNSNAEIRLRTVSMPVVRRAWCSQQYSRIGRITPAMVCVGGTGRNDACQGDSGGPALQNGQICGVVSWGYGCARRGFPGILVNIQNPSVKQFIRQSMKL